MIGIDDLPNNEKARNREYEVNTLLLGVADCPLGSPVQDDKLCDEG